MKDLSTTSLKTVVVQVANYRLLYQVSEVGIDSLSQPASLLPCMPKPCVVRQHRISEMGGELPKGYVQSVGASTTGESVDSTAVSRCSPPDGDGDGVLSAYCNDLPPLSADEEHFDQVDESWSGFNDTPHGVSLPALSRLEMLPDSSSLLDIDDVRLTASSPPRLDTSDCEAYHRLRGCPSTHISRRYYSTR